MADIEQFAARYGLVLEEDKHPLASKRIRSIPGQNGSVIERSEPDLPLLASIVYLSTWERVKLEFRLASHRIRVLPDECTDMAVCAEFSPDNERQARLVIELARLKGSSRS